MLLIDEESGECYEVDEADCEFEGEGFWLLAADGEDEEEFYELVDEDDYEDA